MLRVTLRHMELTTFDTLSPVAKLTSVCLFLSLAATSSIGKLHFFIVISPRRSIWNNLQILLLKGSMVNCVKKKYVDITIL